MKEIALICERNEECQIYANAAQIIAGCAEIEVDITNNPKSDKNAFDTVIFVFEEEPHNNCPALNSRTGHQHIVTVSGDTAEDKLNNFAKVFRLVCGIPEPLEIERKFLIKYPPVEKLSSMSNCCAVDISQVYLDIPGKNVRIRKRTVDGITTCIRTEKSKVTDMTRVETETVITQEEYDELMQYKHPDTEAVEKTRYCLMHLGKYFEIDVFPFWKDKAYLEIELISEDEKVEIPPFIKIIKEVTQDKRYTNKSIAGLLKSNMVDTL